MWNLPSGKALRASLIWVVVVAMNLGCAPAQPPPIPQALREQLSPLRMVVPGIPTVVTLIPIPSGRAQGAAHGAGQAVAGSVQGCLDLDPTGICALVALFLSPYLAVGGAVYGLAAVEPEAKVSGAQSRIQRAMAQQAFHALLARRVGGEAAARGGRITRIPFAPQGQGRDLPQGGCAVKLELAVMKIGLGRKPAVNPRLYLTMEARMRVLRNRDGAELYRAVFPYRSPQGHEFSEWASDGAAPLREELGRAYQALAEAIVGTVLVPINRIPKL